MSHRTALAASLLVTALLVIGVIAGRERYFAPAGASQDAGAGQAAAAPPVTPAVVAETPAAAPEPPAPAVGAALPAAGSDGAAAPRERGRRENEARVRGRGRDSAPRGDDEERTERRGNAVRDYDGHDDDDDDDHEDHEDHEDHRSDGRGDDHEEEYEDD
ncbi:MAG: hypothetical protein ACKOWF_16940 [Chloroflexota bacterium]